MKKNFDLRRERDDVRLLQKRVNLLLVCPKCAKIRTTEEGVAKMFYKADLIDERIRTWKF